jgi:hypothetical protein
MLDLAGEGGGGGEGEPHLSARRGRIGPAGFIEGVLQRGRGEDGDRLGLSSCDPQAGGADRHGSKAGE